MSLYPPVQFTAFCVLACLQDIPPARGNLAMVHEFMERGSVYFIMHDSSTDAAAMRPKSLPQRLRLAVDVAQGMKFLHNSNIIHGNLSSINTLVDDDGRAKLSDFGMHAFRNIQNAKIVQL